ncbi:nucleotide exchange factor GrpE [Clostridium sp. JN-9]|uniref:nucleotide exchange factor GrpE n=1 Tax=Clostridium sp. JN-9 TaxID=2507159 RepID=UPI0026CA7432
MENKKKVNVPKDEEANIPKDEETDIPKDEEDMPENNEAEHEVNDTDNHQKTNEVLEDKDSENEEELKHRDNIITDLTKENLKLKDDNEKINNELEALKERLVRNSAEYENYRKRTAKEKEGIYTDACEDILKSFLPVLDNLERAVSAEGDLESLKKGVDMTLKQFNSALDKLDVVEIPSEGEFDPNFHNAVMHVEDENQGKNKIVEVFQKGYKRGDKVLRFSMVKVAN